MPNVSTSATISNNVDTWNAWNARFQLFGNTTCTWTLWNQQLMNIVGNGGTVTITSDSSTINNQIWTVWNQPIATSASITSSMLTWTVWNQQIQQIQQINRAIERRIPTEEEIRARREREIEALAKEEIRKKQESEARIRAELLLNQHLSEEQKEDLEKKNCFFLYIGDEKYQINRGRSGNVKLLDKNGQVRRSFCIHPRIHVPDADTMLAQKLLLETDREEFHRIANITEFGGRG